MDNKNEILNNGLFGNIPVNGGLNMTNYPNQWGLRAYKNNDGSYGGEMMPKYSGWQGPLKNIAYPNSVSTEISVGDSKGDFPSIVPTTTAKQLSKLLSLKNYEKMPNDIYETARQFAEQRRMQGLSPFKDVWDGK